jgi:hypothetical protein
MADVFIGGGSNVSLNASENNDYYLTGLDANGKVLLQINVTIFSGGSPTPQVNVFLPSIQSLNFRNVVVVFEYRDYDGEIVVNRFPDLDFINGTDQIIVGQGAASSGIVQVTGSNSWFAPAIDVA